MTLPVRFLPQARQEAIETRDWYELRQPGLGALFAQALAAAIDWQAPGTAFDLPSCHGLTVLAFPSAGQQALLRHAGRMDFGTAHGFHQVDVVHARSFDDAQAVALAVREQRTVLLQLDQLEPVEAQRVVDFVSGAINALEGQSERLGETTFLFAPADVLVSRS